MLANPKEITFGLLARACTDDRRDGLVAAGGVRELGRLAQRWSEKVVVRYYNNG